MGVNFFFKITIYSCKVASGGSVLLILYDTSLTCTISLSVSGAGISLK